MTVTPKERQRIIEFALQDLTKTETIRALNRELPHLSVHEVIEVLRVHHEEMKMDLAVSKAEEEALGYIAAVFRLTGCTDLKEATAVIAEQGDLDAAEVLVRFHRALALVGDLIQVGS
jgi:hypothetical protein